MYYSVSFVTHDGASFQPGCFGPVLASFAWKHAKNKVRGASVGWKRGKLRLYKWSNFFDTVALSFFSYGWSFSLANLHQIEMKNTLIRESKETGTRKGSSYEFLSYGCDGLIELCSRFPAHPGLLAPIWVKGGAKSNYERKGRKFYLYP